MNLQVLYVKLTANDPKCKATAAKQKSIVRGQSQTCHTTVVGLGVLGFSVRVRCMWQRMRWFG